MVTKAILFGLGVITLFNLPVCCCFGPKEPVESKKDDRSCSHCSKTSSPSPSVPHSKSCGCDHGLREMAMDVSIPSFVLPSGPDSGEPVHLPMVAIPEISSEIVLLLGPGPPPPREKLPLYLLVLHLLV